MENIYIRSKCPKFYPLNAETRPASIQSVALKEIYDYPRIDVAFPLDDLVGVREAIRDIFENRDKPRFLYRSSGKSLAQSSTI